MTQLFDNCFYTDDFDQEMIDFIESKGWEITGVYGNTPPSLSDKFLYYGSGIEEFWTDSDENMDGYEYVTKQEFISRLARARV